MQKIVILVIASFENEHYKFLINEVWSYLIDISNDYKYLDIFLLFDNDGNNGKTIIRQFPKLKNNIIMDKTTNLNEQHLCVQEDKEKWKGGHTPGILSKTIYAFEKLKNKYDIFYRTNLSSIPHLTNLISYVNNYNINYSGFNIWWDWIRNQIREVYGLPYNKCIKTILDLSIYKGNSFVGGSGVFLNYNEVALILKQKHLIRYDIVDDLSIGLLLDKCHDIQKYNRIEFQGNQELHKDYETYDFQNVDEELKHINKILDIRIYHWGDSDHERLITREIWKRVKNKLPKYIPSTRGFSNKYKNVYKKK